MSYKATNWAYDMKLTGPAKPVLVALADMADEDGTCFPGQEKLAEMTGLAVATVRRALLRLEALGLLSRERRYGQFGYRTSDRYRLHLDVNLPESLPLREPSRRRALKALSPSLPLRESTPTAHSERAIEPSVNHQKNHQGERPSNFCGKHPNGTTRNCGACGDARRARAEWDEAHPKETIPGILTDPACEHHYPPKQCPVCREAATA